MSKGSDGQAAGEVSLSNRRETSPFFGADGVGIDRLSLSFPVHEFEQDRSATIRLTMAKAQFTLAAFENLGGQFNHVYQKVSYGWTGFSGGWARREKPGPVR